MSTPSTTVDPTVESLSAKAVALRALHERPGPFVIANAWDIASARMLQEAGFAALATSSAAAAEAVGRRDGQLTREETLAHVRLLAGATPLPLSADLGNGFGHRPEDCALTIRLAAEAGAVGGSIEDSSSEGGSPILDFDLAVERVAAAVEAARVLPFPFVVTARAIASSCRTRSVSARRASPPATSSASTNWRPTRRRCCSRWASRRRR